MSDRIVSLLIDVTPGGLAYDAAGNEVTGTTSPYIYLGENIQLNLQFIVGAPPSDVSQIVKYTGFASSTIACEGAVDNNYTHYTEGALTANKSGEITSLSLSGLSVAPRARSGTVQLINSAGEYESVNFTAYSVSSGVYTFTVAATLTYSYLSGDTVRVLEPPIISVGNSDIDQTNKATGAFVLSVSGSSTVFESLVKGLPKIPGLSSLSNPAFEFKVYKNGVLSFVSVFELKCLNLINFTDVIAPAIESNYYTKTEADSRYIQDAPSDTKLYGRQDGAWEEILTTGDVVGPASATSNNLSSFDGVTGKLIKDSGIAATAVSGHIASTSNPHSVTAAQVGNGTAQWNANKLQGVEVATTAPSNGQSLVYNSTSEQYEPTATGAVSSVFGKTGAVANISDTAGFLYNNGSGTFSYSNPTGSGDVMGPSSSIANNVAMFDGVTGKILKDSGVSLSGSNTGDETLATDSGLSLSSHVLAIGTPTTITSSTTNSVTTSTHAHALTVTKTDIGLANVENTALSTWAGSSNITTVGTLTNLTVTNAITGSVSGNAGTVTNGVYVAGDQTVAGVKTFSSSPIVPTPTTDYQAATKKYVDDNGGGGSMAGYPLSSSLEASDNGKTLSAYVGGDTTALTLLHLDNALTDSSLENLTYTNSSATFSDSTYKFGTHSAYFNGSAFLYASASSKMQNIGTGDFTFESWANIDVAIGSNDVRRICSQGDLETNNGDWAFGFGTNPGWTNTRLNFAARSSGSITEITSPEITLNTSIWYHIQVTRSSGVVYFFLNGTLLNADGTAFTAALSSSQLFRIGCRYSGGSPAERMQGYMDEFRGQTAAKNTSSFTVETAAYTDLTKEFQLIQPDLSICQGRLTLESGVAVSTTDQLAKTTLYWEPYNGNLMSLYNGSAWILRAFEQISLSLSGYTADSNYDIFGYDNAGTAALASSIWLNNLQRKNMLYIKDGVYVKSPYEVVESYGISNSDGTNGIYSGYARDGQSFTLANAATLSGASFSLAKKGTVTGSIYVKLYAATGTVGTDAVPTGSALATSAAIDITILSTTVKNFDIPFVTPYTAEVGDYCIELQYDAGDANNALLFSTDNSSPGHAGNFFYYDNSYHALTSLDTCFTIWKTVDNADTYRYLGTIRTTGTTGQTEISFGKTPASGGSAPKCLIWNMYNQVSDSFSVLESDNSWTYTTKAWRYKNNSANNRFAFVNGISINSILANSQELSSQSGNNARYAGVGYDASTALAGGAFSGFAKATDISPMPCSWGKKPTAGFHFIAEIENSEAVGTTTWWGDSNDPTTLQSGMNVTWSY
jgi:hypothetical protein